MAYIELMDGWNIGKEYSSSTGKREFRENVNGDIASLPSFGDSFPGSDTFIPSGLVLNKITKSYPNDDHAHYTLSYETASVSGGGSGPEGNTIPSNEGNSESFQCHPSMASLGDGEDSGLKWAGTDRSIPFNVGKRIIEGEYTYTFTDRTRDGAFSWAYLLGKISDSDNHWLFSEVTMEQGVDTDGSTTYRISRTYQYHNADGYGWQFLWDNVNGEWNMTFPTLYKTTTLFPDPMPF